MSKILKVTIEYEDKTMIATGKEAEKWKAHGDAVSSLAMTHNMNPFNEDPVTWEVVCKSETR